MPEPLNPPQPYPYEGCCEHSANAHSRKHCLLCDCEKAPQVMQVPVPVPAPPPEPEPDIGVEVLHPCGICKGLTVDREGHQTWHERELARQENFVRALTGLAARLGQPLPADLTTPTTEEQTDG